MKKYNSKTSKPQTRQPAMLKMQHTFSVKALHEMPLAHVVPESDTNIVTGREKAKESKIILAGYR